MNFLCPKCTAQERTLSITDMIELPPDARSDEITLQVVACSQCGFRGIAVYEESRRGALDQDSFSHTGYTIGSQDLDQIRNTIKRCPEPRNPRCDCSSHKALGKKDSSFYWIGIKKINRTGTFDLDLG